jgi:hypothetical protein
MRLPRNRRIRARPTIRLGADKTDGSRPSEDGSSRPTSSAAGRVCVCPSTWAPV